MAKKTNAMRILDSKKIKYESYTYGDGQTALSGAEVAALLCIPPEKVFKTLVTVGGKSGAHFVFMIPVAAELDLKKAAQAVGEKSVEMIKSKELLPLTGYIHGGCSPIGMKKQFRTVLDASATAFDSIVFSGGKIGLQAEVRVEDLQRAVPFTFYQLTRSEK